MTTISTLVTDAMYAARVLGQDQTPSSGDSQLVLRRLQRMLDSWSNESSMIFLNDVESFQMTAGVASYSTSLLTAGRPVSINSMRVTLNNIDYPVDFIDQIRWNQISYKLTTSIPSQMYYDDGFPQATMFFYPIPYAAFTCNMYCKRQLTGGTPLTLTTVLSMPLGYEAAIVAGLAVDISPSFGKQPTPDMLREKTETRSVLKRVNYMPLEMNSPFDRPQDISSAFPYRGF
jgi:hypothetical protein